MATFNTKKILYGPVSLIPSIAHSIQDDFLNNGFEVSTDSLSSGGYDISITKGGTFKAIMGMKTALKVTLLPNGNTISFEAGVGIWGQQAIPTVISMLFFWPVLITQIWGIINQAKLDDKALEIANEVISKHNYNQNVTAGEGVKFCTSCGTQNGGNANFCCGCGKQL